MSKSPVKNELCFYIVQILHGSSDPDRTRAMLMDIMQRITAGEDTASIEARYSAELTEIRNRMRT